MIWAEGLFILIDALIDRIILVVRSFRREPKRFKEPHWREMDYKYLEALNELNVMCPTDTDEEKGLARYLEFNSEKDHVRRQHKNEESPKLGGTVHGSFTTLHSPGLSQLLGGGLANSAGGLLGGLGGGLAQQQQQFQQQYAAFAQQQQLMQPGTAQNNINPLAALLAAQQKNKDVN